MASALGMKGSVVEINRAKDKARKAADTGRHRDAIRLLEGVVERAPEEWAAVLQLGDLYAKAGRRKPAVALYRRLAEHHEEEGHQARAAALWQKVVRTDPGFHGAHLKLGSLYAEMGRRVEARRHYESVLGEYRKQGREGEASMIEGLLAELQDGAAARHPSVDSSSDDLTGDTPAGPPPAADPVLTLDPDPEPPAPGASEPTTASEAEFVEERLLQGRLLRRYGLLEKARAELELLLERAPGHVEGREELRDLLREQGDHEAAAEQQHRLDGGRPDAGTGTVPPEPAETLRLDDLEGLGELVREDPPEVPSSDLVPLPPGLFDDLLDEVAARAPGSPGDPPSDGAVVVEDRRQSPEELAAMVTDFRDRVDAEVDGNDFETRYNLGIAYREMGLLDEAIGEFQRAAKEPERIFDCAGLLAQCFVDKGLPQLAVSWLERGLEVEGRLEEEYQELRYELAGALELTGDGGRAAGIYVELYGENARLRDVAEKVKRLAAPCMATSTGASGEASDARRGVVLPWRRD